MGKQIINILIILQLLLTGLRAAASEWVFRPLDERHLAFSRDDAEELSRRYLAECKFGVPAWARQHEAVRVLAKCRPQYFSELQHFERLRIQDASDNAIAFARCGVWLNPVGQASLPVDKTGQSELFKGADIAYFFFVELAEPLNNGVSYSVTFPTGETARFTWQPSEVPSELFKIDQIGYVPAAGRKYAYAGTWLGTLGALPLRERFDGKPFCLKESETGAVAFTGSLRAMNPDAPSPDQALIFGEETLEIDFSEFSQPGQYYLEIEGIGRSHSFMIDDRVLAEAFFLHTQGLFHKRCGIRRTSEYTAWTTEAPCHTHVIPGNFVSENAYGAAKSGEERGWGFVDEAGASVSANVFNLIHENPPQDQTAIYAPGGWHDAADFDRRPQHLGIVEMLANAYLLAPENFIDGQLGIPENRNGIPDILDEAAWGLKHLMATQLPNGAVGIWFETDHHPRPDEYDPAADKTVFNSSIPTRNSTLQFCAAAALLANALQHAGDNAQAAAEPFIKAAEAAWSFAAEPANNVSDISFRQNHGKIVRKIVYTENSELPADQLTAAGLALYYTTGKEEYLSAAEQSASELLKTIDSVCWRWSPLHLSFITNGGLELPSSLHPLRSKLRNNLFKSAKDMLRQLSASIPYRPNWHPSNDWRYRLMGWGNALPLNRALTLAAAARCTDVLLDVKKFHDAALLGVNFHNGANPLGLALTSGMGYRYPSRFLDLPSLADSIPEYLPGITPFFYIGAVEREDFLIGHGLYYPNDPRNGYPPVSISLLPNALLGGNPPAGLPFESHKDILTTSWPYWRRWSPLQSFAVTSNEFTVWETIAPAVAATGLLLQPPALLHKQPLLPRPDPLPPLP